VDVLTNAGIGRGFGGGVVPLVALVPFNVSLPATSQKKKAGYGNKGSE
jgi:hypothetical protein